MCYCSSFRCIPLYFPQHGAGHRDDENGELNAAGINALRLRRRRRGRDGHNKKGGHKMALYRGHLQLLFLVLGVAWALRVLVFVVELTFASVHVGGETRQCRTMLWNCGVVVDVNEGV